MNISQVRQRLFDIAVEFETTDTAKLARIDRFIQSSIDECNEECFGAKAIDYVAYMTAHELTLSPSTANSNNSLNLANSQQTITEKVIGDVKFKYGNSSNSKLYDDPLSLTRYGIRAKRIADNITTLPFIC